MFWGNGDSSKLTESELKTLNELRRLNETGHIVGLTAEQSEVAMKAVRFYAAVSATSGILAGVKNVGMWIGGFVLMWWAFRDAVVAFIKGAAG